MPRHGSRWWLLQHICVRRENVSQHSSNIKKYSILRQTPCNDFLDYFWGQLCYMFAAFLFVPYIVSWEASIWSIPCPVTRLVSLSCCLVFTAIFSTNKWRWSTNGWWLMVETLQDQQAFEAMNCRKSWAQLFCWSNPRANPVKKTITTFQNIDSLLRTSSSDMFLRRNSSICNMAKYMYTQQ